MASVTVRVHGAQSLVLADNQDPSHSIMTVQPTLDVEFNGRIYHGLHCEISQAIGPACHDYSIHVSLPTGYDGPLDTDIFAGEMERYYRGVVIPLHLLGQRGNDDGQSLRPAVALSHEFSFEVPDEQH